MNLADLTMYGRFACKLPFFLRRRIDLEDAQSIVERRLGGRKAAFLMQARRGIYEHAASPYLPLLRAAGCELGDLERMVAASGLEDTLHALHEQGVYVTFEEFKGRRPIVRNGVELPVEPRDFDNPRTRGAYEVQTGGSTGPGTRTAQDLDHLAATAPFYLLAYDAHGVRGAATALWQGVLPASTAVNELLRSALIGNVPRRWFTPVARADLASGAKYRAAMRAIRLTARVCGVRMPAPERVPLEEALTVARWAGETSASEERCLVRTSVSTALRVAVAAREAGLGLSGVTFLGGGEPPTPAKMRGIAATGARFVPTYATTETGPLGMGCADPLDPSDVHLLEDAVALIRRPRTVPDTALQVDAFCFTTLLPTAPKLMLNVESDDYGEVETRACGCPLGRLGYSRHIRNVFSYQKLTGEGMTLVGSDMLRILEDLLPARFGGTPLDYQLHEEEDELGLTRLTLVVDPSVGRIDDGELVALVLRELRRGGAGADLVAAIWHQAGTLRVKRVPPVWTGRGKLLPLHVARRGDRAEVGPRARLVAESPAPHQR